MILKERKLNRLNGYDYSQSGWYFITIDCWNMYHWFGKIVGTGQCPIGTNAIKKYIVGTGQCPVRTTNVKRKFIQRTGQWPVRTAMELNDCGLVAEKYWKNISNIFNDVILDEFVIMPNHVHGIIHILNDEIGHIVGTGHCPVRTMVRTTNINHYGKLSKIINGYKNIVTKEIRNELNNRNFKWQRSFYDEIIRDKKSLERIRKYIIWNPKNFLKSK